MKVKLKDVASFSKGQQINGDDLLPSANYAYLNGGISPSGYWNEYNIPANSIAISEGGNSCGYVNYMQSPFWCGAHCYYLFDLKISNTKYLYYALKARQDDIMKLRSGACMPNIKKSDLGELAFEFDFDDDHQTIVVDQLERVERMIALRKQQLSKLDELVKSRFVELFGDPVCNSKNLILSPLNDVCTKITDGTHDTPPRYDSGYLLITGKNIRSSGIIFDDVEFVSEEDHKIIYSRCNPEYGDVLYTNIGVNYGTACYNNLDYEFSMKNVALLKPNHRLVNGYYLWECLNIMRNHILSMNQVGGAQTFMGLANIKKIIIPVPPIELQKQFAAFVGQVDKSKLEIQRSLEKLETLRKALMQQYFG